MKEIDFLPAAYRERNAVHKARLCQLTMVLAFGGMILLAAGYQIVLYRTAKHDLALITVQHEDAIAKTTQLATLRLEVEKEREFAELYTYLKYPWPRTTLLAEIVRNLPAAVTLQELAIIEETSHQTVRSSGSGVSVAMKESTETPAKADLETLKQQRDGSRSRIQVSGTTTDAGALHLFVMALNGTPLFESAKLHSMEAVPGDDPPKSKFLIRLITRPGYGQPGGPQGPTSVVAQEKLVWGPERS